MPEFDYTTNAFCALELCDRHVLKSRVFDQVMFRFQHTRPWRDDSIRSLARRVRHHLRHRAHSRADRFRIGPCTYSRSRCALWRASNRRRRRVLDRRCHPAPIGISRGIRRAGCTACNHRGTGIPFPLHSHGSTTTRVSTDHHVLLPDASISDWPV